MNLTKNNTSKNIRFTDNYTQHNHKNKTLCFGAVICLPEAERAKRRYKYQEDDFFSAVLKYSLFYYFHICLHKMYWISHVNISDLIS